MKELNSVVERVNGFDQRSTWYLGSSDAPGQEVDGWTGKEILVKKQVIRAVKVFDVKDVRGSDTK